MTKGADELSLSLVPLVGPIEDEIVNCTVCNDAGYVRRGVPFGHRDFGKAFPCQACMEKVGIEQQLENAGVPSAYIDAHIDAISPRILGLKVVAHDYMAKPSIRNLTMSGKPGSGKTYVAVAVLRAIIEQYRVASRYEAVPAMLNNLQRLQFSDDQDSFWKLQSYLCEAPVLVLDDLGAEKSSEWRNEQLTSIISQRYANASLRTIVTSNLPSEEWHERIASRLCDWHVGIYVKAPSVDLRQVGSEERRR